MPVIIGTKRIYHDFMALFSLKTSIKEIKDTIETRHRNESEFLAKIYTACERLTEFSKTT